MYDDGSCSLAALKTLRLNRLARMVRAPAGPPATLPVRASLTRGRFGTAPRCGW